MQVQVHADDSIQGGESLAQWAQEEVNAKLASLKEYVVRVEVFLKGVDASRRRRPWQTLCAGNQSNRTTSYCSERGGGKGQGCVQCGN